LNGIEKIPSHMVGPFLPLASTIFPLPFSIPCQNQDSFCTHSVSKFDILSSVTHQVASGTIDIQLSHRLFNQSGLGFSATTPLPVWRTAHLRMMGTVVDAIETSTLLSQEALHLFMNLMDEGFWEITACDPRLIGDHHGLKSVIIEESDRGFNTRQEGKPVDVVHIPTSFEGPIPVKKNGLVCHRLTAR
jgi:hypothetical protein